MIEIKITVPNDEVGDTTAVARRMALLGYVSRATAPRAKLTDNDAEAGANDESGIDDPRLDTPEPAKPAPKKTRAKKAEAPAISTTPEHRVDPETEAQDAADEAEEVAAEPAKVLTVDDLRAAAKVYIDKFTIAAAQEDGPKIMIDALGSPPAGNDGWTMSLAVLSGHEIAAKAVEAWTKAGAAEARYGTGGA